MYPTIEQADGEKLCRRIVSFMIDRGVRRIDRLKLKAEGGVLIVRGQLPSDGDRRLCLKCCQHTAGVVRVVDQTRVASAPAGRRRTALAAPSS